MPAQGARSIAACTLCLATMSSSQILVGGEFDAFARTESLPQPDHHPQYISCGCDDGSLALVDSVESVKFVPQIDDVYGQPTSVGDGSCKLNSQKDCNPTFVEGERKQFVDGKECAFGATVKPDGCIEREECAMKVKKDGSKEIPREDYEVEQCVDDANHAVKAHVDVNACLSQMDKLSTYAREAQEPHVGQAELSPTNKDLQSTVPNIQTVSTGLNDDVLNEKQSEEHSSVTPPPRKVAAWRTSEPKAIAIVEPEFLMEASSWPTLAEARHAKPSEGRPSPSHKEITPVSSPVEKENSVEAPKQLNTNNSQPGPKYRSSYKKSGVPGYSKPNFTENIPVPPMGAHVPSANMFNPDQSMNGNGRAGMHNFFPGPHQTPANGPFYQHRGEGLAPFPHNSAVMPPYGRGHPGWQHHARGYSAPAYDQQHIGPRHMQPPMGPVMNFNATHYNYPNFPGDMSYMPPPFVPPGYNYATPYFGPSGPPGGAMQGLDIPTVLVMLQRQIEYYFSKENLIRDIFLTSKMDEEGFVPLSLIASFPRVRNLTLDSMLILEAMKNSSIVEVKNGKLRSRRQSSATSQTSGAENVESFAPLRNTSLDHAREQGTEISEEGGFDKKRTLPESKMIAGSCAAPWTGLSANLGAINVPAATSIDSR